LPLLLPGTGRFTPPELTVTVGDEPLLPVPPLLPDPELPAVEPPEEPPPELLPELPPDEPELPDEPEDPLLGVVGLLGWDGILPHEAKASVKIIVTTQLRKRFG